MKRLIPLAILLMTFLWHSDLSARDLPCSKDANPVVCQFLNRYISELVNWNDSTHSRERKMRDDKFIIYEGSLDSLHLITDSSVCTIVRYDDMAYEVVWQNGGKTILRVAFPIQYELLLGMPKIEIEKHLQEYITMCPIQRVGEVESLCLERIEGNFYRTSPVKQFEIQSLVDCSYFVSDSLGFRYVSDTTHWDYTLSNLFHTGLNLDSCQIEVEQSVYGFQKIDYSVTLTQWVNYCQQNGMTTYVSIEEEYDKGFKVLVLAENRDLNYNHIVSVIVPKNLFEDSHIVLQAKVCAFIPTHNVSELYQKMQEKSNTQREWEN